MKKILMICLVLLMLVMPVFAAENPEADLVVDYADLLTSSQEAELETQLQKLTEKYHMSVVIVTADSMGGKDTVAYADDFLDYNGYGEDGILLLINMEERQWHISTVGEAVSAFSDADIAHIEDQIVDDLRNENYMDAFEEFVSQCDNILNDAFSLVTNLIIALVIGLIVAWISTRVMKGKLKTVHKQTMADDYVTAGSMKVDRSRDLFLYSHLDRTAKPKESSGSSTHTSSSGRTHGGGGGKF